MKSGFEIMGGNALKSTDTYRISKREFRATKRKFVDHVLNSDLNPEFKFVKSYHNKQSHGDIDVLIKKGTVDKWDLVDSFDPNETHNNGDVVSLDWKTPNGVPFQLDLVFTSPGHWDMQKTFAAFNGLGNLMGKIARFQRFKYGFQGLRYTAYYDSDTRSVKLGEWVLSRDPEQVFEFLGFDWGRFQSGFDELEDVFEYVVDSTYFNYGCFMPKNLNAGQRHRDTKRSTYMKWMDYLQTIPRVELERPSREKAVERAESFFGVNLQEKIESAREARDWRQKAHETFNGNVAMDHFDLKGRELGKALGSFKSQFENDQEYHEYLMEHDRSRVIQDFASNLQNTQNVNK